LKANHPTLFQQIDTWFETARAEGTLPIPSEHTAEAGIIAPKSVKCGRSPPIAPCIRQRNGWDCKQLSSSNVPAICGIKPLTRFSSTLAVCLQRVPELPLPFVSTGALKIPCTGRSMSPLVKMIAGALCTPHNLALLRRFAVNTLNRESPSSAALNRNRSAPPWMMPTCSPCWRRHSPSLRRRHLAVNSV